MSLKVKLLGFERIVNFNRYMRRLTRVRIAIIDSYTEKTFYLVQVKVKRLTKFFSNAMKVVNLFMYINGKSNNK